MDEVIWVEILRNRSTLVARHRFTGGSVRVGRGYGNDLVLDDPHVAPEHIRIRRDPSGVLVAEDLGSHNGMFAGDERQRVQRMVLDGTGLVRIGTTYLRVRSSLFPVAPEEPLVSRRPIWPVAMVLGLALMALWLVLSRLNETTQPQAYDYAVPVLFIALIALAWTGLWALLSHVFSGQARFLAHLVVGLSGLLAYTVLSNGADLAEFSLSWQLPAAGRSIGLWIVLGVVGFVHLRVIGPGRLVLKAGGVAALAATAIVIQLLTLTHLDTPQWSSRRLFPPYLRLAPAQTEDAYFAKVQRLKGELDEDRRKPP